MVGTGFSALLVAAQHRNSSPVRALGAVLLVCLFLANNTFGAVLPDEKLDLMLHSYKGGGSDIKGPTVLVRKNFSDKVSSWGSYYYDHISSASIDVVTQGSEYSEDHTQINGGLDYLVDRTLLSLSAAKSIQDDYDGNALSFGISQEFFGDLSTLSMSYSQGNDTVKQNGNDSFSEDKMTQRYAVNLTQILTRNWMIAVNLESVAEEGYLQNPYRSDRYLAGDGRAVFEPEFYPSTRNSDAIAVKSIHYLPYRAAIKWEARYFSDSWDISATNFELKYVQPYNDQIILEGKLRYYDQSEAFFYNDLFDFANSQAPRPREFRGRDKELSQFSTITVGAGATYELKKPLFSFFDDTSLNLYVDYMQFDYDNFRDARESQQSADVAAGEESLYSFDAWVSRFFISMRY